MLNVLIIDDELKARNIINHYLVNFIPEVTDIRQASSVAEALVVLASFRPAIVFLDVEMPHQSGFDFLMTIANPSFDIVFTTAYNQYAIQAIRFSALDYLLKPIDPDELIAAVRRYKEKQKTVQQKLDLYDNLVRNIEKKEIRDFRLAVPSSDGVFFFTIDEILRLEADRNYTIIHLTGKRPFVASKTLKHFEDMLEDFHFIRTHKSHLVNPSHITRISHNNEFVLISDGSKVEVSRRKKEEVQQLLNIR